MKTIAKLLISLVTCLLMLLTSLDYRILKIWSIVLFLTSNRLAVIMSKSLYRESNTIMITIESQKYRLGIIAV